MTLIGTDVSGWQAANVNLSGLQFVVSKATQGTTYVNPNHAAQVAQARAAGLLVGHYHFADGNTPEDEAAYFLRNTDWRPGEVLALDVEHPFTDNVAGVVAWSNRFHVEVHRRTGVWPLHYMDAGTRGRFDWSSTAALGVGLWDAEYNSTGPYSSAPWAYVAIWQNADTNISGGDSDQFYGEAAAWHRYGSPAGTTPAAPAKAPAKAAPAPVKAPAKVAAKPVTKRCTVVAGDTLSGIAVQVGVTLAALEAVNPGINYNVIHAGQLLNLPANANTAALRGAPAVHPAANGVPATCRVEAGDSLSSIGTQFGVNWLAVAHLNGIAAPYTIYPNQVLRLH